jgi:molybdate transport system substrate-binding protein
MRSTPNASRSTTVAVALSVSLASVAVTGGGVACKKEPQLPVLRIAAAADLRPLLAELAPRYEQEAHVHVELVFGASGSLAKQIAEGAPYDLFASASEGFVDEVVRGGACDGATRARFAEGQLALVIPGKGSGAVLDDLRDPLVRRVAIAQPLHAPYGQAAKQALTSEGLWDAVSPKLVYADNVAHAHALVKDGNVDAAVVAASLAPDAPRLSVSLHSPLRQTLVACGKGSLPIKKAFIDYLLGAEGQALLRKHAFRP